LLGATLDEHGMVGLDEQAASTKEGAGWPPVGRVAQSARSSFRIARLASFSSRIILHSAKPMRLPYIFLPMHVGTYLTQHNNGLGKKRKRIGSTHHASRFTLHASCNLL